MKVRITVRGSTLAVVQRLITTVGVIWWRSIVVRTSILASELSLSCARLMNGRLTTLWVKHPLSVNQQDQLSLPFLRGRLNEMSSNPLIWVTEGGDFSTADWGCLAGRCASLCLQAAHGGRAAGGSG